MAAVKPVSTIDYAFDATPETGATANVAPGVHWLRMPLPFALTHINLWLLEDCNEWVIVDTGLHADDTLAIWRDTFAGMMGGRPVDRVIATHMHPDHAGNAGWLCKELDAELLMTREEYLYARVLMSDTGRAAPEDGVTFYHAAGFPAAALDKYQKMFGMFGRVMSTMPDSYRRLQDGDRLAIDGREWEVIIGNGHSPEHACLFCEELDVLISGDQVLPTISSNIGVYPTEPHANPLADWLASIEKLHARLPDSVLVLPAHGKPFRGVHDRLEALRAEHQAGLDALQEYCREPRRAIDTFPALFRRDIRSGELIMATGEAVAHLNWLIERGRLRAEPDADGVLWYTSV